MITGLYAKAVLGPSKRLLRLVFGGRLGARMGGVVWKAYARWLPSARWPFASFLLYAIHGVRITRRKEMAVIRFQGFRFVMPPADAWVFHEIFFQGFYEQVYRIRRGDVVLDVGAHVGIFSAKASRDVGKGGLVVAIEPGPRQLALLHENLKQNRLANVAVVPGAVGAGKGQGKLFLSPKLWECSTLDPVGESVEVEIDTLDGIVDLLNLDRVDFVKIDVEGVELAVLEGARGILSRPNVKFSIAAYHKLPGGGPELPVLVRFLRSRGAQVQVVVADERPHIHAVTSGRGETLSDCGPGVVLL